MAYLRQEHDALNTAHEEINDRYQQLEERLESVLGQNADRGARSTTSRRDAAPSIWQSKASSGSQIKALSDEQDQLRGEPDWLKAYNEKERDRTLLKIDSERQAHSKTTSALASRANSAFGDTLGGPC